MARWDTSGALRRIRRLADLSQRELAQRCGVSQAGIAQAETGRRDLPVGVLDAAARLAGLRLALIDGDGREVEGMSDGAVRDFGRRRFPAHLDTRHSDEGWWHGDERYSRAQPWFTYDRHREGRDARRQDRGTPEDHHLPRAGDSPLDRRAARRRAALERRRDDHERRRVAGELQERPEFGCVCPPACDELDDWSGRPVHAEACGCRCDLG